MYLFFSFLLGGVAFMIWILESDKKQAKKVNTIIKENKSAPTMHMLKSTEQKISKLKAALNDDVPKNKDRKSARVDIYNNKNTKQIKIQELLLLSSKYNAGQISLEDYNSKLDELLIQANRNGSLGLVG
ncbi:MAG TPA: hypothetical protein VGN20_19520 [Mucilaginibacter sp.]